MAETLKDPSITITGPKEEIVVLGQIIVMFAALDKSAQARVVAYLDAMLKDPKIELVKMAAVLEAPEQDNG